MFPPESKLHVTIGPVGKDDARLKMTFYADTRDQLLAEVRLFIDREATRDSDIVSAICAQVHAWRAGIGSAEDAMRAISKLLHEQAPGQEGSA